MIKKTKLNISTKVKNNLNEKKRHITLSPYISSTVHFLSSSIIISSWNSCFFEGVAREEYLFFATLLFIIFQKSSNLIVRKVWEMSIYHLISRDLLNPVSIWPFLIMFERSKSCVESVDKTPELWIHQGSGLLVIVT